jgi:hypothetical protein
MADRKVIAIRNVVYLRDGMSIGTLFVSRDTHEPGVIDLTTPLQIITIADYQVEQLINALRAVGSEDTESAAPGPTPSQ